MISIKSAEEISIMREGGRLLAEILEKVKKQSKPGVKTKDLDKLAESLIIAAGAKPAFKGYDGFPSTLCTSVNQVIVHQIPSDYQLKDGDIFTLDIGLYLKGFFSDMAQTIPIGKVNPEGLRLIRVTKRSLKYAIQKSRAGNTFGDIGNTIQRYVESQGLNVVRELCGHGIGKDLHEEPDVLNYGQRHKGPKIEPGMVFCIEPMVTLGDWQIKQSADKSGWETTDGSFSAHFEHEVAILKNGKAEVLTKI